MEQTPDAILRNHKPRVSLTLSGPILGYVAQLQRTGLYGRTRAEVVRELMTESLRRALERGFIGRQE